MHPPVASAWPAGWYLLQGTGHRLGQARATVLRLRAEYGQATGATESIPLAPRDPDGALSCVVLLKHPCSNLQVESDGDRAAPPIEHLTLHRVNRLEAASRMLAGLLLPDGARDWSGIAGALGAMVSSAMRGGIARGGDVLLWHYHASIHACAARRIPEPAAVRCELELGGRSTGAQLQPIEGLQACPDDDGAWEWEVTNEDPQFRLATPEGLPMSLPAGWYGVGGRFETRAGRILSPLLYPDYGDGASHESRIRLPEPDASGEFRCLVLLKYPVASLRFDPTTRRARFVMPLFRIQRISRASAFMAMLDARRRDDGQADWAKRVDAGRKFLRTASRRGMRVAGDVLREDYEGRLLPARLGYDDWVERYDTLTPADGKALVERASHSPAGPLISILVPVYETPEPWLRRCLDSVLQQAYPHWELCIADDASTSGHVRKVLAEYQQRDPRIRVTYRERNGHIAEASNTALAMACGEFVALLDHDDELRPHALLEVAEAITARPGVELLYSDEDKLDTEGRRCQPNFKPDWNPDLLLSQNYVCHFTAIRTARARAVGGFRTGFEGSQDHDLILRCTEELAPAQIHHIPKVLYHWRAIAGSTALERGAKDYASSAGARAVAEHLQRMRASAHVDELDHGHYRVRWHVPEPAPRVSLIVPTRDKVELLRMCIDSVLERTRYPNFEIIVVDNQSTEPEALAYLDELRSSGRARVLAYDAPFNFSAINNWAASQCDGELLCLLNNDIEVISEDWLDEMVGHAMRPQIGAVGAMLYYPDDTIQHAGVILGLGGVANHAYAGQPAGYPGHGARALVAQNLSAVTGACLLVRRRVYEQMGGLDERLRVAFNDIDFCLRLCEAGYRNVWTPFARLYHHESASRGTEDSEEKMLRFRDEVHFMEARWGGLVQSDPAYNPNLTLEGLGFELAVPPRPSSSTKPAAPSLQAVHKSPTSRSHT